MSSQDNQGNQDKQPLFGVPRQGVHAVRIPFLDFSLIDTIGTLAIAALTCSAFNNGEVATGTLLKHFAVWWGIGFIAHRARGVDTAFVMLVKQL